MLTTGPGVVNWVEDQLGARYGDQAQGIGWGLAPFFTCGAVYEAHNGANVWVHIAKVRGTRFPPTFIAAFFDYPFRQLGCNILSATIAATNTQSIEFAKSVGATRYGCLPEALPDKGDLLIFGLLRKDAGRWLTPSYQRRLGGLHGRSSQRDTWLCEQRGRGVRQAERAAST